MEFSDVVRKRRMVRNYRPDPVDQAAIDRLLDSARRGPTAGFSQGQYFVVVTDPADRRRVAELCDEETYVAMGFDPWLSRAPVHIFPCVSKADYARRYEEPDKSASPPADEWRVPFWWVDGGAAMMLLLLAAVDEGLAAGFIGVDDGPELRALLGLPDEVTPVGLVTVGHPAPDRRSGSLKRGRKPATTVVHHGRWQSEG